MPVLYIMGEGRSGSTLLDIVLSNLPGFVGVGELWTFLENDTSVTGKCSCGATFHECDFWNDVREAVFERVGHRDLAEIRRVQKPHDQLRRLPVKLAGRAGPRFDEYCAYNTAVYEAILEVSGGTCVLDSTKQVGRGFNLLQNPDLDVKLLHLVRDGRAVMWSRVRDLTREPGLVRKGPMATTAAWTIKNAMALQTGRRAGERYLMVRYEDFAANPVAELKRIGAYLGVEIEELIRTIEDGSSFTPGHQIGGNERARLNSKRVRLRPDMEWQKRLDPRHRRMFWRTSGWLARHLGYSRMPSP